MTMDSYLMMLYVTLEQESALKQFFVEQGWKFCKPDLSVTTDKLGPSVIASTVSEADAADVRNADPNKESSKTDNKGPSSATTIDIPLSNNKGKRKSELSQQTPTIVKHLKLSLPQSTPTASQSGETVSTKEDEPLVNTSKVRSSPVTVLGEDGKHFVIKVEREFEEEELDEGDNGSDRIGDNTFNDDDGDNFYDDGDDDDNDESMNLDYTNWTQQLSQGDTDFNQENQSSAGGSKEKNEKGKDYICSLCGKTYRSKGGFCRHRRGHKNASLYKCCGKDFYDRNHVIMHRCSVHGLEKTEKCPLCEAKFATQQGLRQHINGVHGTRHKCLICGLDFSSSQQLTDHMTKHNGTKAHVCRCGRRFQYVSGLSRHRKNCTEHNAVQLEF